MSVAKCQTSSNPLQKPSLSWPQRAKLIKSCETLEGKKHFLIALQTNTPQSGSTHLYSKHALASPVLQSNQV